MEPKTQDAAGSPLPCRTGYGRLGLWALASVFLVCLASPAAVQAQGQHGIGFSKGCSSPTAIGSQLSCTFTITNNVDTGNLVVDDTLLVHSLVDWVCNTTAPPLCIGGAGNVSSGNVLFTIPKVFSGGASCGATFCTLPPDSSITAGPLTHYTTMLGDPDPLPDQASLTWSDTCNSGASNCPVGNQFATAGSTSSLTCPTCATGLCFTEACNEATNACVRTCDATRDDDCEVVISDCVWSDLNGTDACQDPGDGAPAGCPGGIDGVDVDLLDCTDPANPVVADTTATAGGGLYEFTRTSLDANCVPVTKSWAIAVDPPAGFTPVTQTDCSDDTIDSDCDVATGESACRLVNPATDTADLDCGFDPPEDERICRTPGFWGSHGGEEKRRSQNITQQVIDAAGSLTICGQLIDDTEVDSQSSALEAICVSGGGVLQLTRQLTAFALNCVLSGFGADCSGDPGLATLLADCNATCDTAGPEIGECIETVDCLNNGGTLVAGVCVAGLCSEDGETCGNQAEDCAANVCDQTGMCSITDTPCVTTADCAANTCEAFESCHDRDLCPDDSEFCFEPPGPGGSSKACNAAKKSDCTVPFGDCDVL